MNRTPDEPASDRISPEELRGLLGDDEDETESDSGSQDELDVHGRSRSTSRPAGSASSAGEPARPLARRRVLVLSRRRDEAARIVLRLREAGASAETVRDAFRGLDRLRVGDFDGVISDLGLWADRGRLLLERVSLPVVFVAGPQRISTASGALAVLERPFDSDALDRVVAQLLGAIATEGAPSSAILDKAGEVPTLLDEPPGWNPAADRLAREEDRDAMRMPAASDGAGESLHAELAWLRLFLRGARAARSGMLDARSLALLVLETLGGSSAAICLRRGVRSSIQVESRAPEASWRFLDLHDKSLLRASADIDDGRAEIFVEGAPAEIRPLSFRYQDDLRWLLREVLEAAFVAGESP